MFKSSSFHSKHLNGNVFTLKSPFSEFTVNYFIGSNHLSSVRSFYNRVELVIYHVLRLVFTGHTLDCSQSSMYVFSIVERA